MHEKIEHLHLIKGRIAMLSGSRGASERKNTGADNRSDPKGG
jgi:hypothetical protein